MTRRFALAAAVFAALLATAAQAAPPAPAAPQPPSLTLGDLYSAVEMSGLFADQKTFADAIPDEPPAEVRADYERQKQRPGFDLRAFVRQHFAMPPRKLVDNGTRRAESVGSYIADTWNVLERKPDEVQAYSSLLPLAYPYIVPGGRFSEIYYWDTYFIMLGLEQNGHHGLALDTLKNIASLIDRYGHVPNGNRTYYLSRSEPPFFACMVELIAARDGDETYLTYLPELQAEYDYWTEGAAGLTPGTAHRHVVRLGDGTLLNRYWDDRVAPRDESYREDVETARHTNRPAAEVYRDLRAGAESGWDFSSRWLADGRHLWTIRTTSLAPVDLNSLMVHMEQVLARAYRLKGDAAKSEEYAKRAETRADAIRRLMWDRQGAVFTDYLWREQRRSPAVSVATVLPLYFGIATPEQARAVAGSLRREFLEPGGLGTTLLASGQQWDRPNGWAPVQFLAVVGLVAYGERDLAQEIATRWIRKNVEAYDSSGVLLEKYNVETSATLRGGGGEYPLQVGFGWTNGVLAKLMAMFAQQAAAVVRQHPAAQ